MEWLGTVPYSEAWELQRRLHAEVVSGGEERVLLLEHPPVITLGKSAKPENLLVPEEELERRGVEVFRVDRGGDATFHGPGQLVAYFILRTESAKRTVEALEEVVKRSLNRVAALNFTEGPHAGVWVDGRKIASIGLALKRGATMHGFALNLTIDLSYFLLINPCGLPSSVMTSLKRETGLEIPPKDFYPYVIEAVEEVFGAYKR
ncbi:MAG: lipoyl(octanoyl) transferase LipB [Thermotogae bacterium]|nr:lipoyl(octanoyl) transferase LipB [Thermotogota bacterium]